MSDLTYDQWVNWVLGKTVQLESGFEDNSGIFSDNVEDVVMSEIKPAVDIVDPEPLPVQEPGQDYKMIIFNIIVPVIVVALSILIVFLIFITKFMTCQESRDPVKSCSDVENGVELRDLSINQPVESDVSDSPSRGDGISVVVHSTPISKRLRAKSKT